MIARSLLAGCAELGSQFGRVQEASEGGGEFGGAAGIDVEGAFRGDFGEAGGVGGENRDAAGHGLGDGEAEAFVKGRISEDGGRFGERGKVPFGDVAEVADAGRARLDALGGGAGGPSHGTGQHQFEVVAA